MRFKTKPFEHQLTVFNNSKDRENYAFFMEMGTGKSKVLIDTLAYNFEIEKINAAVIVAPLGICGNWLNELETHISIPYEAIRWQSSITKKFEAKFKSLLTSKKLSVFIVNIEALRYPKANKALAMFLKEKKALMAVDESTTIKNHKAKQTINAINIGIKAKMRRILTGSPITRSPLDLWGQMLFLDKGLLGYNNYYAFRARYAILQQTVMAGGREFKSITGYKNLSELTEVVNENGARVLKKDCLDLPEKLYTTRKVLMTDEMFEAYESMRLSSLALFENGECTAPIALTRILRQMQIACGFLKLDNGDVIYLKENRTNALMEASAETSGKVIIWATFTSSIQRIYDALIKEYGPKAAVHYYGKTTSKERDEAQHRFKTDKDCRFFIGNPSVAGFGLTLIESSTTIYYNNNYMYEQRVQSEDRNHRIGQRNPVLYLDIVGSPLDEYILNNHKMKRHLASEVLGDKVHSLFSTPTERVDWSE